MTDLLSNQIYLIRIAMHNVKNRCKFTPKMVTHLFCCFCFFWLKIQTKPAVFLSVGRTCVPSKCTIQTRDVACLKFYLRGRCIHANSVGLDENARLIRSAQFVMLSTFLVTVDRHKSYMNQELFHFVNGC